MNSPLTFLESSILENFLKMEIFDQVRRLPVDFR